jgi:hypothetical protein
MFVSLFRLFLSLISNKYPLLVPLVGSSYEISSLVYEVLDSNFALGGGS